MSKPRVQSSRQPAAPAVEAPRNVERLYVVTKTCSVPYEGSMSYTRYTLHAGDVLSSFGYDVDKLLDMGVPMEPISARPEPPKVHILG